MRKNEKRRADHEGAEGISRRDLLRLGGVAAAGAVAAGALVACAPNGGGQEGAAGGAAAQDDKATNIYGHQRKGTPSFFAPPEPVTAEEAKEYDIVVIGAGAAGAPCALKAAEEGARVCLIQNAPFAVSQGNAGAGILLDKSQPWAVAKLVSEIVKNNQNRAQIKAVNLWAQNSGEAVQWVIERTTGETNADGKTEVYGGFTDSLGRVCQVQDIGNTNNALTISKVFGIQGGGPKNAEGTLMCVTSDFSPKPGNAGHGMMSLCKRAEEAGAEVFYDTRALQLVKEGERVVGVLAEGTDGKVIQFNGSKAVVVATGDFQNDDDMMNYYLPDCKNFARKQAAKTGDGHKMCVWAGAKMEDFGYTKMLHDFDAGGAALCEVPFLNLDYYGNRFVNEEIHMSLLNNYLRGTSEVDAGWYVQVFDSKYLDDFGPLAAPIAQPAYLENAVNPEVNNDGHIPGVFPDLIRTYKADTLEELAKKVYEGVGALSFPTPQPNAAEAEKAFLASIARYNELANKGEDDDFGKNPKNLKTIEQGPFYAIYRHVRLSCGAMSGIVVNPETHAVCDASDDGSFTKIIPGLYALGNMSSGFYGGVDYPLDIFGMSLGRCYTEGYVVGRDLAKS